MASLSQPGGGEIPFALAARPPVAAFRAWVSATVKGWARQVSCMRAINGLTSKEPARTLFLILSLACPPVCKFEIKHGMPTCKNLACPPSCRCKIKHGMPTWKNEYGPGRLRSYKGTAGGLAIQFAAAGDKETAADTSALSGEPTESARVGYETRARSDQLTWHVLRAGRPQYRIPM